MKRIPNKQQQLVIDDLDNNIILFASAGTGKTFTVANRIKNIIDSECANPEEILCVTFTVKACKEMADDIGLYLGLKAKETTIKTIHGFCLLLLKEEAKKNNDRYVDIDVCDEIDEQDALLRLIEEKMTYWQLDDFLKRKKIVACVPELYNKESYYDPQYKRFLWLVSVGNQQAFISSSREVLDYHTTKQRLENSNIRFQCPFCRRIIEGFNNSCPECGENLRTYLTPISTPMMQNSPGSLRNIATELKRCRYLNSFYYGSDETDYSKAFEFLKSNGEIKKLFTFYDRTKRKEIYDEELARLFESYGGRFMAEYDQYLQNSNLVDFDDIIIIAAKELKSKETRRYWQNKYKYVFLDEMQDTSVLEYEVLSRLFEGCNSMMCGDYFQTIYSWRGSVPKTVLADYIKRFRAKTFMFSENYRSTRILAEASFGYLKNTFPDLIGEYCPSSLDIHSPSNGDPIEAYYFYDSSGEAQFIWDLIRSNPPKDPSSFCIMARSNNYISGLAEAFSKLEKDTKDGYIPRFFTVEKGVAFYRTGAVKDILAFLRVLLNDTDSVSMERLASKFIKGVGSATINRIHESGDIGVSMSSFLNPDTYSRGDCYGTLIDACMAGNVIVYDTETTGLDLTSDQVIQISAVRYGPNGNPVATFDRIVIPTVEISQGARNTIPFDIDEAVKTRGIPASEAFREFSEFVKGSVLVGHNSINYDAPLIARQLAELGLPPLDIEGEYDTLSLAKQFYPSFPNFKLATLCDRFSVVNEDAHNALGDVKATGEILFHMLRNNILLTQAERIALLSKYREKFVKFYSFLMGLKKDIFENHANSAIERIIDTCSLRTRYKTESSMQAVEDVITMFGNSDGSLDFVREFVSNAAFSGSQIDTLAEKLGQIPIITVHQSKGCEFDTVILAGCDSMNFPTFAAVKEGNEEEEKRVFYVAISRAKKRLIITCNVDYERFYPITPSPYIDRIPSKFISCEHYIRGDDGTWQVVEEDPDIF